MEWTFKSDQPIYAQLVEQIRLAIVSGDFVPGARLSSVRDMVMEAGVNPNTLQRALQELERLGLVYSQRTAGRFVTEDTALITKEKKAIASARAEAFLQAMRKLGFGLEEIITLLRENKEEEHGDSDM